MVDQTSFHANVGSKACLQGLGGKALASLAAVDFLPNCVTHRGNRKLIAYDSRFKEPYQLSKFPAGLKESILSTLFSLFIEPYSPETGQAWFGTHPLESANLRFEEWMRDLREIARVSRVDDEWSLVWSEESERVMVHAVCRHKDLYSIA